MRRSAAYSRGWIPHSISQTAASDHRRQSQGHGHKTSGLAFRSQQLPPSARMNPPSLYAPIRPQQLCHVLCDSPSSVSLQYVAYVEVIPKKCCVLTAQRSKAESPADRPNQLALLQSPIARALSWPKPPGPAQPAQSPRRPTHMRRSFAGSDLARTQRTCSAADPA